MHFKSLHFRFYFSLFSSILILYTGCNKSNDLDIKQPEEIVINPEDRLPKVEVNTNGGTC